MHKEHAIRRGTKNVFADLGFPDAETHLRKAWLVSLVQDILAEKHLAQAEAARIAGVSQPDLYRVLKGRFRDVPAECIVQMLAKLVAS